MAAFYNQATLSYNNTTVSSNLVTGELLEVLRVSKTAVSDEYGAGDTLTYTVSLVNTGNSDITGITLTDDLGAYSYETQTLVPLTYTDGSVQYFSNGALQPAPAVTAGDTLVISGITVPANGNAIIIYQADANEFAPLEAGSQITNTVTASGSGADVSASAVVSAENTAELSITKSLSPAEVPANGNITYTFVIQNSGNTAENTAVMSDLFDPVLTDIEVTIGGASPRADAYTYSETTGEFVTAAGAISVPAASYTRDAVSGAVTVIPGTVEITITGNIK